MNSILYTLLLAPVLATPLNDGVATELRYTGSLTPRGRDTSGASVKQFNLYCLVTKSQNDTWEIASLVEERGGGGWSWPERFGQIELDSNNKPTNPFRIRLLHEHKGSLYPLELRQPLFEFSKKIKEGAKWNAGKYSYEVGKARKVNGHDSRQIEVSTNFGRRQVLYVEDGGSIVVEARQKMFIGQGEEFELKWELKSAKSIDEKQLAAIEKPLSILLQLKSQLKRDDTETDPELNKMQLAVASKVIDLLEKEAEATPFSRLSSVISRDVKSQRQRAGDVTSLAQKFIGKNTPNYTLRSIDKSPIDPKDSEGKIVVLHFWEYQGEPLAEPYGQVGYLDFLNSRRRKLGVKVYGIAVDPRLGESGKSSAAVRSIRKLKSFMNLGFPIARDDGSLLEKFGDPRKLGAKLPLWVVIAPDGTIAHYKVGFYEINPDEGLRELDDVVIDLIKKQRGK